MSRRRRVYKTSQPKKRRFLEAYARSGYVSKACQEVGISRRTFYDWLKADETFATDVKLAEAELLDRLEQEADRRALEGLPRKKFTKSGDPIIDPETSRQYVEREYSDTLLIFRMKALAPEKYRDTFKHEHSGPDGGPIPIREIVVEMPDGMSSAGETDSE